MEAKASDDSIIKTGDEVLMRDSKNGAWSYCHFSHTNKNEERKYVTAYVACKYCIPFKGNENLVGTTKDFIKPFVFKFGAKVKAWNTDYNKCINGILISYDHNSDFKYQVAHPFGKDGVANWFKKIEYLE